MKKATSKSAKIRAALEAGEKPQAIATKLKVPVTFVYTENWKRKNESKKAAVKAKVLARGKKIVLRRSEVDLAEKLGVSAKTYAKEKAKIIYAHKPANPALDFLREELASVERQIDSLNTIASFLAIRLRQMEQNEG